MQTIQPESIWDRPEKLGYDGYMLLKYNKTQLTKNKMDLDNYYCIVRILPPWAILKRFNS